MRWPPEFEDLEVDTNAGSSGNAPRAPTNWAWWAALTMLAAGAIAVLYVLFAAASKPEQRSGLLRFAQGHMHALTVMEAPPPMPTRALRDAAGTETTLAAFKGQVMVVNLWATWCAPCMEEMPTLAALQRRYEGRLRVIPVSMDGDADIAKAQRELAQLGGGALPFLVDISRGTLFDTQAAGMPMTIIYDAQGREIARLGGGADWASEDAAALFDALLAGE
jgi:thiol-disulfide isomerase/thioredoxin